MLIAAFVNIRINQSSSLTSDEAKIVYINEGSPVNGYRDLISS